MSADEIRLSRLEADLTAIQHRIDGYSDRIREVERREAADSIKLDNALEKLDDVEEKVDGTNRRLVGLALSLAGSAVTFAFVILATLK